jgi:hypothetical protein
MEPLTEWAEDRNLTDCSAREVFFYLLMLYASDPTSVPSWGLILIAEKNWWSHGELNPASGDENPVS